MCIKLQYENFVVSEDFLANLKLITYFMYNIRVKRFFDNIRTSNFRKLIFYLGGSHGQISEKRYDCCVHEMEIDKRNVERKSFTVRKL